MPAPHTAQPIWHRGVQIPAGTANAQLRCQKALEIIPRATHLFEEPGALAHIAQFAAGWFQQHLHPARISAKQQRALLDA
jgi:hypothetical protein